MGAWVTTFGKNSGGFFGIDGWGPIAVSFSIPLTSALTKTGCDEQPQPTSCEIHLIAENGSKELIGEGEPEEVEQRSPAPCPGSAQAPAAEPGNLCLYLTEGQAGQNVGQKEIAVRFIQTTTRAGVILRLVSQNEGALVEGTWAVTAS